MNPAQMNQAPAVGGQQNQQPSGMSQMDQAMLEYMTTMGQMNQQEQDQLRKQKMVEGLRGMTGDAQGRMTGRVYTAANPLEHIAKTGENLYQMQQQRQGLDAMQQMGQQRQNAFNDMKSRFGVGGALGNPLQDPNSADFLKQLNGG